MNKVMIMGNLTSDPIFKTTETTKIAKLLVAVNRDKDNADFFKVVAFGRTADYINNYAVKGSKVLLEGNLTSSKYVDKNGVNQYVVEIIVDRIWVLSKDKIQAKVEEKPTTPPADFVDGDDLPF
jgi:single-strand DNA-binding protein